MTDKSDLRYVAHLDMLGMRELALRDPDGAWRALSGLSQAKDERFRLSFEIVATGEVIENRVTTFTFSDTVVAFSIGDSDADLRAIVILVAEFFCRAMYYRIPLRGGIAHGRFMFNFDRNLFAGPALVHAYLLSEQAQWLGIRVDNHIAVHAKQIPLEASGGYPSIVPWSVPVASGSIEQSHVVDWVVAHRTNFLVKPPFSAPQFYEPFAGFFGPFDSLPDAVRLKYENTVAFINDRFANCSSNRLQRAGQGQSSKVQRSARRR